MSKVGVGVPGQWVQAPPRWHVRPCHVTKSKSHDIIEGYLQPSSPRQYLSHSVCEEVPSTSRERAGLFKTFFFFLKAPVVYILYVLSKAEEYMIISFHKVEGFIKTCHRFFNPWRCIVIHDSRIMSMTWLVRARWRFVVVTTRHPLSSRWLSSPKHTQSIRFEQC